MTSKALVVLSGGQDSTTCLYWALNQGFDEVHAITFDYNQRHRLEIEAAKKIAADAGVASHQVIEIGPILGGTSPLVSDNELEQYPDGELPGGLEKTFVPMRNQTFLTLAANRAYVLGARNLVTGVCQEDFGGYPDCRQVFIDAIENACNLGTFTGQDGALGALKIHTPLMDLSKAASVDLAIRLDGCYGALAYSHTSYDGQYPPLGADHATMLRAQGFEAAGVADPLILRAACEGLMELPDTANYDVAREVTAKGPKGKAKTWTADEFVALVLDASTK
uniref:7-cyano-7-deazaguanine synthase n=1 Tax=Dinoroseobacter phage vB_DshS_R26L TaxID=3161158 RepID=A0AAU7VFZ2_9CAUD